MIVRREGAPGSRTPDGILTGAHVIFRCCGMPYHTAARYVEYDDSAIGMRYCIHINPKSKPCKKLLSDVVGIGKRARAYDWSWELVGNAQDELAAAFISDGDTIAAQLLGVVPILGFFEFEPLRLFGSRPPLTKISIRVANCPRGMMRGRSSKITTAWPSCWHAASHICRKGRR